MTDLEDGKRLGIVVTRGLSAGFVFAKDATAFFSSFFAHVCGFATALIGPKAMKTILQDMIVEIDKKQN